MSRLLLLTALVVGLGGCCALGFGNPEFLRTQCGLCPAGQTNINGICYACGQHPGARCPAATGAGPEAGVAAGADVSTTAGILGLFGNVGVGPGRIELAGELGLGSEEGYHVPERAAGRTSLASGDGYWVFQTYLHGKYPIPLGSDGRLRFYPLAGVRYYRFAHKDCDASTGIQCVFTQGALDLGAGLAYGPFSVEAFTGLFGDVPDASVRARFAFPLGRR